MAHINQDPAVRARLSDHRDRVQQMLDRLGMGLVPRQASSGGKERLLGISKRGDAYVRNLRIHGARAVIHHIRRRLKAGQPGGNPWVEQLLGRCHIKEAAVALANKMARIVWVLTSRQETDSAPRAA